MKRERATKVIEEMLTRLCAREPGSVLDAVAGVDVFGSYARGALAPNDIDLNVELDSKVLIQHFEYWEFLEGKHVTATKRALVGGSRQASFIFDARQNPQQYRFELTQLWNPGDDLPTALARLRAITEDPLAGTAQREHMLPAFEGLEKWLPTYLREHIVTAVAAGALTVEQIELHDTWIDDDEVSREIDFRWTPGGLRHRGGKAILAYFESQGIDLGTVCLHGQEARDRIAPYYGDMGLKYIKALPNWFVKSNGIEYIEIPHLTDNQAIKALRFRAVDTSLLLKGNGTNVIRWAAGP